MLDIYGLPALQDNYIWVIHDTTTEVTAVVDPAEPDPVLRFLREKGWKLAYIFNTHTHWDHIAGNLVLKQKTDCRIIGAEHDRLDVPGLDRGCKEGDDITMGSIRGKILSVPGHTPGHLAYWFSEEKALFCGDTLFSLGCGRLLGGTAEQLWASLDRLRHLPPDTRVYCAHEYTQKNGHFALTLEPSNLALIERMKQVDIARHQGKATVPSILSEEIATNPFLRPESKEIKKQLGYEENASILSVFTELRRRKDVF